MRHPDVATEWAQPPSGAPHLTEAQTLQIAFLHGDKIMNTLQTTSTLLGTDVRTGYISAWMESSMHIHKLARSSVSRLNLSCVHAKIPALYHIKATAQVLMAVMMLW